MRYTLQAVGPTVSYKRIVHGRKAVGRVYRHTATGRFHGVIGQIEVEAATELAAFEEAAARAMGYPSALALRQRNADVREDNRHARAAQQARLAPIKAALDRGDTLGMLHEMDKLLGFKGDKS